MAEDASLRDYMRAYRTVVKEEYKRGFVVNLAAYIIVNILLAVINLMYYPGQVWFIFPLAGWGLGVLMHYLFAVRWIDKTLEEWEARAEYLLKRRG